MTTKLAIYNAARQQIKVLVTRRLVIALIRMVLVVYKQYKDLYLGSYAKYEIVSTGAAAFYYRDVTNLSMIHTNISIVVY